MWPRWAASTRRIAAFVAAPPYSSATRCNARPTITPSRWSGMSAPRRPPTGPGDAEVLAALIEAATLMIGVDSGPLHLAGATTTPTIGVWTRHHPVHFFDLAGNVTHLVPGDHAQLAAGGDALRYFAEHYR